MSDKNGDKQGKLKRPVGRPPLQFPDLIDADPTDVAKAAFKLNPNKIRTSRALSGSTLKMLTSHKSAGDFQALV